MNIMDQVITIVQSGAIPLLAIMTFIALQVFHIMQEK